VGQVNLTFTLSESFLLCILEVPTAVAVGGSVFQRLGEVREMRGNAD